MALSHYRMQGLGLQIHLGPGDHGNVLKELEERAEEKGGAGSFGSISTMASLAQLEPYQRPRGSLFC